MLTTQQIKEIIQHRYPLLLVDRILELNEGKSAVGLKNVSSNEPFFNGHFPEYPVMPGVLVVEALAQVSAITLLANDEDKGKLGFFAGIDHCRFKKQVVPGDQLHLEADITRKKGHIAKAKGIAKVDGEIVCEAELTLALNK
ncbi:3-hydroxyacyl-ACP dehydratase FabZ [Bacillus weihaiensis]|uniref:3-hydroxyacyl-[acyl-carrier-protein] dehydratase FabZ n=1 Tax=Bacillus weihaiensis TaxID=1547283 RepID=A0A1L3MV58_9BACI|nr:3-hydroxyacyl-ACP dehydratase FabZ [Bacillus weihaiensis]APH06231.1 3-hydroxyacyl-[acyl-carrier-protein] dehydratase FabZ [Bacillus weihaiensis]